MMNSTPEERGCQAPVGTNGTPEDWSRQTQTTNKPFPPLYDKIKQGSGLTSSDLNAIVEEIGGKPIINTVIHPQHLETHAVPVEGDGEKISLGGKLVFDKKRIQQLIGVGRFSETPAPRKDEEEFVRRQPVSGRNAYEIRADLVQLSMELLFYNGASKISPEEVVSTAKVLYSFIEDRNRR